VDTAIERRSRRALLVGAAAAAVGVAAGALGRPAPAWAAQTQMLTEANNTAASQTSLTSGQTGDSSAVFAAYSTATTERIYSLFGQTASSHGYGMYGYSSVDSVGVEGHSALGTGVVGVAGSGETHAPGGVGVYGSGTFDGIFGEGQHSGVTGNSPQIGLRGSGQDAGVFGTATAIGVSGMGKVGVRGLSPEQAGTGVEGTASSGTGMHALSTAGTALKVDGKARFNRSGRASVARNRAYVDVDLTALGGISGSSLCFANLAYPRSGVWIRAVRPNYPATGKMRIYLNKVASTSASTQLSWLVLENA
jgi:hypothetical protein